MLTIKTKRDLTNYQIVPVTDDTDSRGVVYIYMFSSLVIEEDGYRISVSPSLFKYQASTLTIQFKYSIETLVQYSDFGLYRDRVIWQTIVSTSQDDVDELNMNKYCFVDAISSVAKDIEKMVINIADNSLNRFIEQEISKKKLKEMAIDFRVSKRRASNTELKLRFNGLEELGIKSSKAEKEYDREIFIYDDK